MNRMTASEYRRMSAKPKRQKYNAVRTEYAGVMYASKAEADYAAKLDLQERIGLIRDLRSQVPFDLAVKGNKIGKYVADFVFTDTLTGEQSVVDVKGVETPIFKMKKKLMKAIYDIDIKCIKAK